MERAQTDFLDILEAFLDQYTETGILFPKFRETLSKHAHAVLEHTDVQYMPGFKLTALMADMVNLAATISADGWLSEKEALKRLEEEIAIDSPMMQLFLTDARMERARYEPLMLTTRCASPLEERNAILQMRLERMIAARQSHEPLPHSFCDEVKRAGERAIEAECFSAYRTGAMLQMFSEMIDQADEVADNTYDELSGLAMLKDMLGEHGRLWKLFRFKASRFEADKDHPLQTGEWESRANMLYIPPGTMDESPIYH
ncbi:MAG: hypothetical protein CMM94_00055 [Rickettsiales bacterium]|nr:hypothetical protein [Rickettsiales bacterium]